MEFLLNPIRRIVIHCQYTANYSAIDICATFFLSSTSEQIVIFFEATDWWRISVFIE